MKVGFSWSVVLIAGLYTVTLATNRFPVEAPGLSRTEYWVAGVAGALLFFASLLAHEMGHALVARHEGLTVRGISLWLFGGLTRFDSNPETPGAELRIAAVGPLTTASCAVLFFVLQPRARRHRLGRPGRQDVRLVGVHQPAAGRIEHDPCGAARRRTCAQRADLDARWQPPAGVAVAAARVGQVLGVGLLGHRVHAVPPER